MAAYRYGIFTKSSFKTSVRVSDTIPGGDSRFQRMLFPIWQIAPLEPGSATVVFLDPHSWAGTRFETIEKILAAGNTSHTPCYHH